MSELLPLFPLRTVLFPGALLPLHVFEPRYRLMLSRRLGHDPSFGVVLTRSGGEVGDQPDVEEIGTSASIVEHSTLPDGRSNLLIKGAQRFQILDRNWDESYMVASVRWLDEPIVADVDARMDDAVRRTQALLASYLATFSQATGREVTFRLVDRDPVDFAYAVARSLPMPMAARQRLLETESPHDLLALLEATVRFETAVLVRTGAASLLSGQAGARFTSN